MRCMLTGLDDRPGLRTHLAARGIAVSDEAELAIGGCEPGGERRLQLALAPRRIFVLAHQANETRLTDLLDAGFADAADASISDALIAARVAALLRDRPTPLTVGSLAIDPLARRASRDGCVLALLPREYAVLLHLARHAGKTVARSALRLAIWGSAFDPGTNVLEVHVSRLRAKLDRGFARPMLLTEKGLGYRLVAA